MDMGLDETRHRHAMPVLRDSPAGGAPAWFPVRKFLMRPSSTTIAASLSISSRELSVRMVPARMIVVIAWFFAELMRGRYAKCSSVFRGSGSSEPDRSSRKYTKTMKNSKCGSVQPVWTNAEFSIHFSVLLTFYGIPPR